MYVQQPGARFQMQNLQNYVDIVTGFTAKGLHEALELTVSYKNVRHVSFFYAIYMLTDRQRCRPRLH